MHIYSNLCSLREVKYETREDGCGMNHHRLLISE